MSNFNGTGPLEQESLTGLERDKRMRKSNSE